MRASDLPLPKDQMVIIRGARGACPERGCDGNPVEYRIRVKVEGNEGVVIDRAVGPYYLGARVLLTQREQKIAAALAKLED